MKIELLADNQSAISTVANWYFEEWGHLREGNTPANVEKFLNNSLNTNEIPLVVLAVEAGEVLGAAQLKYREMDIYPEKEHWLGGVYVSKNHRRDKIAEKMIQRIVSIAEELGVKTLYLQTERLDGGLYNRLGWKPITKVNSCGLNVLVMERELRIVQTA